MAKYGLEGYYGSGRLDAPNPLAPTPAQGVSRSRPMGSDSDPQIAEAPPLVLYRVVDNWTSLSKIQETLGPDLLSRLPTLDQLNSRSMSRVRPFDRCPLAIQIGCLLTPDQDSLNYTLPIYASIGTRRHAPLHIYTPAEENLMDIISTEFETVDGIDSTTFFQDWKVFDRYVHILWDFPKPHCWNDLRAQVTYCLLLAWASEFSRTTWDPIPTRIDIADTLAELCRGEPQRDVGHPNGDGKGDDDNGDDNDFPPSYAKPVDDGQGNVTGGNGSVPDEPYSLPISLDMP